MLLVKVGTRENRPISDLIVICRTCGSELPEAARYCPACGAAVEGRVGEERKIVTVLLADLVDSTATADERDPEDVRAALRPQVARMREELERFGGTFEISLPRREFKSSRSHGESGPVGPALSCRPYRRSRRS